MKAVTTTQHASAKSLETCAHARVGSVTGGERITGRETHLADAADILVPRLLVKSEVLVEAESDVVAVEAVGKLLQVQKVLLEGACDRGLERNGMLTMSWADDDNEIARTFPLALRPVNQIVTPFCLSSCARSGPSTEPEGTITPWIHSGRTRGRTRVKGDVSGHRNEGKAGGDEA